MQAQHGIGARSSDVMPMSQLLYSYVLEAVTRQLRSDHWRNSLAVIDSIMTLLVRHTAGSSVYSTAGRRMSAWVSCGEHLRTYPSQRLWPSADVGQARAHDRLVAIAATCGRPPSETQSIAPLFVAHDNEDLMRLSGKTEVSQGGTSIGAGADASAPAWPDSDAADAELLDESRFFSDFDFLDEALKEMGDSRASGAAARPIPSRPSTADSTLSHEVPESATLGPPSGVLPNAAIAISGAGVGESDDSPVCYEDDDSRATSTIGLGRAGSFRNRRSSAPNLRLSAADADGNRADTEPDASATDASASERGYRRSLMILPSTTGQPLSPPLHKDAPLAEESAVDEPEAQPAAAVGGASGRRSEGTAAGVRSRPTSAVLDPSMVGAMDTS